MNELDIMKQEKEKVLGYWNERLIHERELNKKQSHDIQIVLTTLEWFLWMIDGKSQ